MLVLQRKSSLFSLNYTFSGVTSERCSAIFAVLCYKDPCFKVAASFEPRTRLATGGAISECIKDNSSLKLSKNSII